MTNRTESQRAASRRNGAKSRGPITPDGRAASAGKPRHQTLGQSILLDGESSDAFSLAFENLDRIFHPQDPFEASLVEMMATCHWRQTRILEMERAAILTQPLDPADASLDPASRAWKAFRSANSDRSLEALHRQSARLDRQYHQALQALHQYRQNGGKNFGHEPGEL
jgi:hypothetical protein